MILKVYSYNDNKIIDKNLLKQIFIFDNDVSMKYKHIIQNYSNWISGFYESMKKGAKIIIVLDDNRNVLLYSRYIIDKEYNNLYIRDTFILGSYQKNIALNLVYYKFIFKEFLDNDIDFLRLSTHKNNHNVIKMFRNKYGFYECIKHNADDYITFSIHKEVFLESKIYKTILERGNLL